VVGLAFEGLVVKTWFHSSNCGISPQGILCRNASTITLLFLNTNVEGMDLDDADEFQKHVGISILLPFFHKILLILGGREDQVLIL